MRLIDADAIKYPDYYYSEEASPDPFIEGFHQGKIDAICEIRVLAPTVDAEPVKHGRWMERSDGFRCSECKKQPGLHPTRRGVFLSRYCPSCGAKMDLEG